MPPSPGRGLPVYQHCDGFLPEAPIHLIPILGCGGSCPVLSGSSSSEPPHLQHEEPGAERRPEEAHSISSISTTMSCPCLFARDFQCIWGNLLCFGHFASDKPVSLGMSAATQLSQRHEPSLSDPEAFAHVSGSMVQVALCITFL